MNGVHVGNEHFTRSGVPDYLDRVGLGAGSATNLSAG
jgi:hypothetical protein